MLLIQISSFTGLAIATDCRILQGSKKPKEHTYLRATALCLQSPQKDLAACGCGHHLVVLTRSTAEHPSRESQALDGPVQARAGKR